MVEMFETIEKGKMVGRFVMAEMLEKFQTVEMLERFYAVEMLETPGELL
jgi:hypothetical protein